jgi:hypothetical protein
MQPDKDLNEALDGLLAGIDSLLADRDLSSPALSGSNPMVEGFESVSKGARRSNAVADLATLSALALACQSQSMGRDAQKTYRALLRKALQQRSVDPRQSVPAGLQGLIRVNRIIGLSPRWIHWLLRLGRSGELNQLSDQTVTFSLDQPLDEEDLAALATTGPLSVLVRHLAPDSESTGAPTMAVSTLEFPVLPELQPVPTGCQLQDVMPIAELDQQSPCLIYWLDHWLPSHPTLLGLALPLRAMPALTDLSWAALVRSTES